jgi:hypothetical protein
MCWCAGVLSAGILIPGGGTSVPEQYIHADGGTYRGQWVGGKKQGLGVYTYPGGGKYAGEWFDNRKSGRGVYTFPKVLLTPLVPQGTFNPSCFPTCISWGREHEAGRYDNRKSGRGAYTLPKVPLYPLLSSHMAFPRERQRDGEWYDNRPTGHRVYSVPKV